MKKLSILLVLLSLLSVISLADNPDSTDDYLDIGGAVRFNIISQNYEGQKIAESTSATLDTWRLNIAARYSDLVLDFEYRFYPTFNTHFIHHGFIGYNFTDDFNMQLGVTQVPFGNLTYNSHSWWFLIPYYIGLEDDYNMGVKIDYNINSRLNLMAAYFRQSEPAGPAYGEASFGGPGAGTYSYNVIPDEDGVLSEFGSTAHLREMNQYNLRLGYMLFEATEIGISGQIQGLYNSVLQDIEYGHAFAAHINSDFNNFNLKIQYTNYHYKARDDEGNLLKRVQMGAYGDPYYGDGVAAKGNIFTAGLAYSKDVEWGPISNIQPYFNYSLMNKNGSLNVNGNRYNFQNTVMMVPGFLITAGNIYTYVDWAFGKNQPWLTDYFGTGLGAGHLDEEGIPIPVKDLSWNRRFNINIGYYF
ncbi:hypothetical protein [Alkalitalea saponilacus]|uniref:Phosphate-selective porin O and P n=1 Tax=Alkalitalea saponilacus TaxID=889453 RepID=A0A1T5HUC9_9BACT|nr:hypothetical protein [Alkalitalea saponilacus]ASB50516.1 hypothetical protein CDL62_15840 [Alkalitalea saponilacus]SKC24151.1 hypothetical protein SAMN03080601_03444 [Alkalitalea saponilacus]